MNNLSRKEVARIKSEYKPGDRIRLISMDDKYSKLKQGDEGAISHVDDIGTIHMNWDRGSSLGLIPNEDKFVKI